MWGIEIISGGDKSCRWYCRRQTMRVCKGKLYADNNGLIVNECAEKKWWFVNNKKKIILLIPACSVVSGQMVQLQNQRSQLLYIEYVGIADIVTRIDGGKKRKENLSKIIFSLIKLLYAFGEYFKSHCGIEINEENGFEKNRFSNFSFFKSLFKPSRGRDETEIWSSTRLS